MSNRYWAAIDLGQVADYTALAIAERVDNADTGVRYDVGHLQRWTLGTSYPTIVADVVATLQLPPFPRELMLIIDGTGVGRAVVDLFQAERTLAGRIVPITITAGASVSLQDGCWVHVPKKDLVATTQVLLQRRQFRFPRGLPETALLTSELQNFHVKLTTAANETFNAREGQHDDLVLAVALLCWAGEHPGQLRPAPTHIMMPQLVTIPRLEPPGPRRDSPRRDKRR